MDYNNKRTTDAANICSRYCTIRFPLGDQLSPNKVDLPASRLKGGLTIYLLTAWFLLLEIWLQAAFQIQLVDSKLHKLSFYHPLPS